MKSNLKKCVVCGKQTAYLHLVNGQLVCSSLRCENIVKGRR